MLHALAVVLASLVPAQPGADAPTAAAQPAQAAAAAPGPTPVETVEIFRAQPEPSTLVCRGVRMSDGRIVAPLVPLSGVRSMRIRGGTGKDAPVASVLLPQSPFLVVLSFEADAPVSPPAPAPAAAPPAAPSIAGAVLTPFAGARFSPKPESMRIQLDARHAGFRTFLTVEAFTNASLGSVATGAGVAGGLLIGPYLEPRPYRSFALLDAASLTPRERFTPEAWGAETGGEGSLAVVKALNTADPAALANALRADAPPVHRTLLIPAVMEFVNSEAFDLAIKAFDAHPELARDDRARSLEVLARSTTGDVEGAKAASDRVAQRNAPDDAARGALLVLLEKPEDAELALRASLAKEAGLVQSWSELGVLMAGRRNAAEAVRCAAECLKFDRAGRTAARIAAHLELDGFAAEAEPVRRDIVAADPRNPDHLGALARNLVLRKKFKEALELADESEAKGLRGRALLEAGMQAAAGLADADHLRRRIALLIRHFPEARSYVDAAQLWLTLERPADAVALLEPAAARFSGDLPFCLIRLAVLHELQQWKDVAPAARRVMELDPKNQSAPVILLQASLELGQLEEADRVGSRLLADRPTDATVLALMVLVAHQRADEPRTDALLERLKAVDRDLAARVESAVKSEK